MAEGFWSSFSVGFRAILGFLELLNGLRSIQLFHLINGMRLSEEKGSDSVHVHTYGSESPSIL
jgi:hypothetical protein